LDGDYDALADRISARPAHDPLPIHDVYSQLLNTEQRVEARRAKLGADIHSANYTSRATGGRAPTYQPPPPTPPQQWIGQGNSAPGSRPQGSALPPAPRQQGQQGGQQGGRSGARPMCQICSKVGHVASCCFKRFQKNFLGAGNDGRNMDRQLAALNDGSTTAAYHVGGSTSSYPVDPYWYADTAAMDHFTNDLNKLTVKEQYHGKDTVQTANGAGMCITHIGQSTIPTVSKSLHLKNIHHVPSVTRNLLSVQRLTLDNNIFFEFHPWYFLIKDRDTREVLLRGGSSQGLYHLSPSTVKQAFSSIKVSHDQWHSRLGHPASPIVPHILHRHELPSVSVNKAVNLVCDACQQGKSHQLPFSLSTRVTTSPLEIIYSDVWGPAQTSISVHRFYVSFVDAYSRFTWFYLLKHKSDVFTVFLQFQQHVE
jgi:histone deacetylase 1/2